MFALRIAHWIFLLLVYVHDPYDLYRKRLTELKGGTRGVLRQGIRHGWPFSYIYNGIYRSEKLVRKRELVAKLRLKNLVGRLTFKFDVNEAQRFYFYFYIN